MKKTLTNFIAIAIAVLAIASSTHAAGFIHPGLLNSKAELDFIKGKIKAGAEPWTSTLNTLKKSSLGNLNWTPRPKAIVDARSNDAGIELDDATAAYTHALLWYFTDDERYARKSVEILNAWSAKLTDHVSNDRQKELVAGWCGSIFPLAGEILRASYPKWSRGEIKQFSTMLNRAFLPHLLPGNPTYNGNWELTMINALMCIGVFNDDRATFNRGVFLWRKRVPAYFYLTSDGSTPKRPYGTDSLKADGEINKYWFKPSVFFDGLCQETLRDYGQHMQEGLSPAINSAEIAFHQGIDLYGEEAKRIMATMEFHADRFLGKPVSKALFPNGFSVTNLFPTWEIAYNHFRNRRGFALPSTSALITTKLRSRPTATHNNMVWERLTHAELDSKARTNK